MEREIYLIYPPSGNHPKLELNFNKAVKLLKSYRNSIVFNSIESNLDNLMNNYRELEKDSLGISLNDIFTPNKSILQLQEIKRLINRRVINFLAASAMYFDHLPSLLKQIDRDLKFFSTEAKNNLYKSSFSFRLITNLRNHVLHRGIPIGYALSNNLIDLTDFDMIFKFTTIKVDKSYLLSDRRLDNQFRIDLESLDLENLDLMYHVRKYLDKIYNFHTNLRDRIDEYSTKSINILNDVFTEYASLMPEFSKVSQKVLEIIDSKENKLIHTKEIIGNPIEDRNYLIKKNINLSALSKLFVSNLYEKALKQIRDKK